MTQKKHVEDLSWFSYHDRSWYYNVPNGNIWYDYIF